MKLLLLLAILFALLRPTLLCSPTFLPNTIQTSTLKLIPSNMVSGQYILSFFSVFPRTPQIAIALTGLSMLQNNQQNQVSMMVGIQVTQIGIQISKPLSGNWDITKISIIASVNSELFLDIVSTSTIDSIVDVANPSAVQLAQNAVFALKNSQAFTVNQNVIVRPYLTGLVASNLVNYVLLANATINNQNLTVFITTGAGFQGTIEVAVMAFPAYSNSFAAYGGTYQGHGSGAVNTDLFQSFSATQKMFSGVSSFTLSSSTSFSCQIDQNFILSLSIQGSSSFELSYLFMGATPQQLCNSCSSLKQGSIYSNGQCVNICPDKTLLVNVGDGQVCRRCPSAMNLGYSNGKCVVCGEGEVAINGVCQIGGQCPLPNMVYNGGKCVCVSGYSMVNNLCIINGGGGAVDVSCAGQYQYFNGFICACHPPAFMQGTTCIKCPQNSYWNSTSCQCNFGYQKINNLCQLSQSTCPWNAVKDSNGVCQCLQTNYIIVNNVCVENRVVNCPANARKNQQGVCQCTQNNHIIVNNVCVYNPGGTCPANAYRNSVGVCVCNQANYVMVNNVCVLDQGIPCPANAYRNSQNMCTCNQPNHIIINNICTQSNIPNLCPPNSNRNSLNICTCNQPNYVIVNNICIFQPLTCGADQFIIGTSCIKCTVNSYWNGTDCQCKQTYQKINGQCVSSQALCPWNAVRNNQGQCVCTQTNYVIVNNICVQNTGSSSSCPTNSYKNSQGQCVCTQTNYIIVNSICVLNQNQGQICPSNSYKNSQGQCMCNQPNFIIINNVCVYQPINCGPGQFMLGTTCIKCTDNSFWNGTQCQCNWGYQKINGVCVKGGGQGSCPANAYRNSAGVCVCNQANYVIVNNVCVANQTTNCPVNASLNAAGVCICHQAGYTIVNNICVNQGGNCPANAYRNSQGQCVCNQANYVIVNNVCVLNQTTTCPANSSLNSAGVCICNQANYTIVNNICVLSSSTCPPNSIRNSQNVCICTKPTSIISNNTCIPCPANSIRNIQGTACICTQSGYSLVGNACVNQNGGNCSIVNNQIWNGSQCVCGKGYRKVNGKCQTVCGDGVIRGTQQCDAGSSMQAGCVNCQVFAGYICTSQPSICTKTNPTLGPSLSLAQTPYVNSNNAYITLKTTPTFTFSSQSQQRTFLKVIFPGTDIATVYCLRQDSTTRPDIFKCLLVYPSGVPAQVFQILVYFNYQGSQASVVVRVDPFNTNGGTRSRK